MKRILICLLLIALLLPTSTAFAKREVRLEEYDSITGFLSNIETKSKVSFDAYLYSVTPYKNEDTYCVAYPLTHYITPDDRYIDVRPVVYIFASQEDIGSLIVDGETSETIVKKHVHINGEAIQAPYAYFANITIMDGKGSVELINPEYSVYSIDSLQDVESFRRTAINYLDRIEVNNGIVISTDDSEGYQNKYEVCVLCGAGGYLVKFHTSEKEFFIEDRVSGSGLYCYVDAFRNNEIYIEEAEFALLQ